MIADFERFLVERFIEFYNSIEDRDFNLKEKRDDRIRNERSYDYFCLETETNAKMGIEVKRLIKKEREDEARLDNYFRKHISNHFAHSVSGIYWLALDYPQIMILPRKKQEQFFIDMGPKVKAKIGNTSSNDISSNPRANLLKISEQGSEIGLFLNNFSLPDETEIERMIKKAQEKFVTSKGISIIKIVLLLEQSSSCRREIRHVIEEMVRTRKNLEEIDEIYDLAIWRNTCIARVFPERRIFRSIFFDPKNYDSLPEFLLACIKYFKG